MFPQTLFPMSSNGKKKPASGIGALGWMPLEAAANQMKRSAARIRSQAKSGQLQRGVHYRRAAAGGLELHVDAYLTWLAETFPPKQQKSLLERIDERSASGRRSEPTGGKASKVQLGMKMPPEDDVPVRRMPKLIPVTVWAEMMFGEYAPHRNTLANWVRNGKIAPLPVKVGRQYFCSPDCPLSRPNG